MLNDTHDPLWREDVEFDFDGDTLSGYVVRVEGDFITVQTDEIIDYDDDGDDENGRAISRPIYQRCTVPRGDVRLKTAAC